MDCTNMLESKIRHFTSYEDISYFLSTSDANCPQKITREFAPAFTKLVNQAVRGTDVNNVSILVQVFDHIIEQNQAESMQMLISCNIHSKFGLLLGYVFEKIQAKHRAAEQIYLLFLKVIIEYSKRMNDHCMWLFQNALQQLLEISVDLSVGINVKSQTVESLLSVFGEDDKEVIAYLRNEISRNEVIFNDLCEKAIKNLPRAGDFQYQEFIVELIFRMWSTDIRKQKVVKWFSESEHLIPKFLAISYDKFDYGVRMFLNEVNSACQRRRVLTLHYKELQVGREILKPSNQWCNCADFCYGSKVLDVRFPKEEDGEHHKCYFTVNSIQANNLLCFNVVENTSLKTVDLHLSFTEFSCQVLKELSLDDQIANNLILRFYRVSPLDEAHLTKFVSVLFGRKFLEVREKRSLLSKSKTVIIRTGTSSATQQSQRCAVDASFVNLSPSQNAFQSSQQSQAKIPLNARPSASSDESFPASLKSMHISRPSSRLISPAELERPFVVPGSQKSSQAKQNRMVNDRNIHNATAKSWSKPVSALRNSGSDQFNKTCSVSLHRFDNKMVESATRTPSLAKPKSECSTSGAYHSSTDSRCAPSSFSQASKPSRSVPGKLLARESSQASKPSRSLPDKVLLREPSQASKPLRRVTDRMLSRDSLTEDSGSDFCLTKNLDFHSKSSEPLCLSAKSGNDISVKKSKSSQFSKRASSASKGHQKTKNKKDPSKDAKCSKSLSDVIKESDAGCSGWNDLIPETQAHDVSAKSADISADLMLGCLHGIEVTTSTSILADPPPKEPTKKPKDLVEEKTELRHSPRVLEKKLESAEKVNFEFQELQCQFSDKENIEIRLSQGENKGEKLREKIFGKSITGRKNTFSAKKKRRSLINIDMSQQLDGPSSDSQRLPIGNDPAMKSVRKMPYAAKFMKTPFASDSSGKKASNKKQRKTKKEICVEIFKTDSDKAARTTTSELDEKDRDENCNKKPSRKGKLSLKKQNIDQRPSDLDNAKDKGKGLRRRKKKEHTELPYEEIEEIPDIVENLDSVFESIETVRDAAPEFQEFNLLPSPDGCLIPKKRTFSKKLPTTTDDSSEHQEVIKKKRPRVSFEEGLKSCEKKTKTAKKNRHKSKRSKKARLFDSTSSAASVGSSEVSWIKDHGEEKLDPPVKTFRKNRETSQTSLSWINNLSRKKVWEEPSCLPGSPEVARSDITNISILSGISRLKDLGCASNLSFNEIASEMDQEDIRENAKHRNDDHEKASPLSLVELSQVDLDELNNNIPIDEICLYFDKDVANPECDKSAAELPSLNIEADSSLPHDSFSMKKAVEESGAVEESDESSSASIQQKKTELPPLALEAALSNNRTPMDTSDRLKLREKTAIKFGKQKARKSSPESQTKGSFYASKKKLQMRKSKSNSPLATWSSEYDSPAYPSGLPHEMKAIVGKYMKGVNDHWKEGRAERNEFIKEYEGRFIQCEQKHNKLLKQLTRHEANIRSFLEKSSRDGEAMLFQAATNVTEARTIHSKLKEKMEKSDREQDRRLERLRQEISKELRQRMKESLE